MGSIVILDKTPSLHRIKEITNRLEMHLVETTSCSQVMSRVKSTPGDIDLLIIDVLADEENSFKMIADIKREYPYIPIIILTSLNTRKDFILGLRAGASDYILKPFDDAVIEDRIIRMKHTKNGTEELKRSDSIDMRRYLDTEIIKSLKGRYSLTVGMFAFIAPSEPNNFHLQREYDQLTERLYRSLQEIFFETDICIPYGNHTLMSIMPFCRKEDVHLIDAKVYNQSMRILNDLKVNDRTVVSVFITIPDECSDTDEMFILLNERLMDRITSYHTERISMKVTHVSEDENEMKTPDILL